MYSTWQMVIYFRKFYAWFEKTGNGCRKKRLRDITILALFNNIINVSLQYFFLPLFKNVKKPQALLCISECLQLFR